MRIFCKYIIGVCLFIAAISVNAQSAIRRDTSKDVKSITTGIKNSVSRKRIEKSANGRIINGYYTKRFEDGSTYTGNFVNGVPNGQGTLVITNEGIKYVGSFKNGSMDGRGILYLPDGSKLYEGNFRKDFPYGEGTFYKWGTIVIETDNWYGNFCSDGVVTNLGEDMLYAGSIVNGDFDRGVVVSSECVMHVCSDGKGQLTEDKNVPYGVYYYLKDKTMESKTSLHKWGVVALDFTVLGTIVTKYVDPQTSNTCIWSEHNEFIEDADTGKKYYIQVSSIGFGEKKSILNGSEKISFVEMYPHLPANVKRINIGSGSFYYIKNLYITH